MTCHTVTPHSTLYTQHLAPSTLCSLLFALDSSHCTHDAHALILHAHTLHSTPYTLHFTLHSSYFTLCTSHSTHDFTPTLHAIHFHPTFDTRHFTFYMSLFALYTVLHTVQFTRRICMFCSHDLVLPKILVRNGLPPRVATSTRFPPYVFQIASTSVLST